jgi:hypothetical protein
MSYYNGYHFNDGQFMFDRILSAFWIGIKWLLKAIVYLPLWFTGYLITFQLLTKKDDPLVWMGLILLFAFAVYQLLFFIKGVMIASRERDNFMWIPLFLACTAFTSVLPAWAAFDTIHALVRRLSNESAQLVTWVLSIAFGFYIYSRYHFLLNKAPKLVFPAYQFGISCGMKLNR